MWHIGITYMMILYDDFYMMMRCHEDTVMLCSIKGSYGWTRVEAAYGKVMIHSIEAILGDVGLERVVGVSP